MRRTLILPMCGAYLACGGHHDTELPPRATPPLPMTIEVREEPDEPSGPAPAATAADQSRSFDPPEIEQRPPPPPFTPTTPECTTALSNFHATRCANDADCAHLGKSKVAPSCAGEEIAYTCQKLGPPSSRGGYLRLCSALVNCKSPYATDGRGTQRRWPYCL